MNIELYPPSKIEIDLTIEERMHKSTEFDEKMYVITEVRGTPSSMDPTAHAAGSTDFKSPVDLCHTFRLQRLFTV